MKDKLDGFRIMILIAVIIVCIIMVVVACVLLTTKHITVEGVVTDVETVLKDDGSIDYFIVTFDNGKTYKIGIGGGLIHERNIDFTVNSSLVIELERNGFSGGVWVISSITKIPGD